MLPMFTEEIKVKKVHTPVGEDPPEKKDGFFKRFLMFVLPKKWHRYLTPEVFIAWNISSWVTLGQVAAVKNWDTIVAWVAPKASVLWKVAKEAVSDILTALSHSQ